MSLIILYASRKYKCKYPKLQIFLFFQQNHAVLFRFCINPCKSAVKRPAEALPPVSKCRDYFAYSMAFVSRRTWTLMVPG